MAVVNTSVLTTAPEQDLLTSAQPLATVVGWTA